MEMDAKEKVELIQQKWRNEVIPSSDESRFVGDDHHLVLSGLISQELLKALIGFIDVARLCFALTLLTHRNISQNHKFQAVGLGEGSLTSVYLSPIPSFRLVENGSGTPVDIFAALTEGEKFLGNDLQTHSFETENMAVDLADFQYCYHAMGCIHRGKKLRPLNPKTIHALAFSVQEEFRKLYLLFVE